jgi:alpha-beta hydrolase superfamily lysophospholipase
MMATSSYLEALAGHLAAAGVEAWTFDFRGHGASVPPSPRDGCWGFADYVERDLPAVWEAVCAAAAGPVSFLGHSLGGLAAMAAFGGGILPPPERLVLVAASPWVRGGRGRLLRVGLTALMAGLARPLGYLPVRRLHAGTNDEPASYLAELAGWVRDGRWPWLDGVARIAAPTYVVVGDRDFYCRMADARLVADRLAGPVALRLVPGADHFGFFRRQPALWDDVAAFLTAS